VIKRTLSPLSMGYVANCCPTIAALEESLMTARGLHVRHDLDALDVVPSGRLASLPWRPRAARLPPVFLVACERAALSEQTTGRRGIGGNQ
jgi:hypothetical protein